MINNRFVLYEDKLYLVKKVIKEEHNPIVEKWKELVSADIVLKREGLIYFVELVPDLELVEEVI